MYRIQYRKYSSNVIEKQITKRGGTIGWKVAICPTLKKVEGDKVCSELINILNK